jgi:hypothetical protein
MGRTDEGGGFFVPEKNFLWETKKWNLFFVVFVGEIEKVVVESFLLMSTRFRM